MAQNLSKTTTDHETIRRWAEERGGKPAEVIGTARGSETGMIRIDFPGFGGAGTLREISWDEWLRKFDEAGLALVYEDETSGGERSSFNELVGRETARARAEGTRASPRQGGRAGARGRRTSASRSRSRSTGRSRRGAAGGRRSRKGGRGGASRRGTGRRSTGRTAGSRRGGQGRRSASRPTAARTLKRRPRKGSSARSRGGPRSRRGSRSR